MKLYVFDAGEMVCTDGSQLCSQYKTDTHIPLANPVFLIDHPNGKILWDTGLADRLAKEKDGVENWIFKLKLKRTLLEQLSDLNLQPEDIDFLAFSHMHIDHTGNANYFHKSTVIVQKAEYFHAFKQTNKPPHFDDYKALENSEIMELDGDLDLFGDGKITFISTPGHTPGHQSLMLRLKEKNIIISGDISYTQNHFELKGVPSFNSCKNQSLQSLEKIEKLLRKYGAELWVQHDTDLFQSLKPAPFFYL